MATINQPDSHKRVNFFNNQRINVEDVQQEQVFNERRAEHIAAAATLDGITAVSGLNIETDTVIAEPVEFPVVANSGTPTYSARNFQRLPDAVGGDTEARIYQVFRAKANNIQRIDLKVFYNNVSDDSGLIVEIRELVDKTNPASGLSDNSLFAVSFTATDLSNVGSDGLLVVDTSAANGNIGVTLTEEQYYAVFIRYTRGVASQDTLDIFHSNNATPQLDSYKYAYFLVSGQFQQGLYDEESTFRQFALYHKIYADAVRVTSGIAFFKGQRIIVEDDETFRYLSLRDRTPVSDTNSATNYVVIEFAEEFTDEIEEERTRNLVATRVLSTSLVSVLTQAEWDLELAKTEEERTKLLLGTVTDRNIVQLNKIENFAVDNTNLAYHNWLNPSYNVPSNEAIGLRQARPEDFIFFLDSVPTEIPLVDNEGFPKTDTNGSLVKDVIASVFVIVQPTPDNIRRFEMGVVTSASAFRSYAAVFSSSAGATDILTFNLDSSEITPNTYYNFVAVTENGRTIFIQDFDREIVIVDPVTQQDKLAREDQYTVHLREGDVTVILEEDLQLGTPTLSAEGGGSPAIDAEVVPIVDELLSKALVVEGTTIVEDISDTLLSTGPPHVVFNIAPLPIADANGILMTNDDVSVQGIYDGGDMTIFYRNADQTEPVDVTFSGSVSRDKGGLGGAQTITGTINLPVSGNTGLEVKVRNSDHKDCTDQATVSLTQDSAGSLTYTIVARGRGEGLDAGLFVGETGYIWIDNRAARDGSGFQVSFVFTPDTPVIKDVASLDATVRFFGEKTILSQGDHPSPSAVDELRLNPLNGQLLFAPSAGLPDDVELSSEYKRLLIVDEELDHFQAAFPPMGFSTVLPIENTDASVALASSTGDLIIKVELDPTAMPGVFTDITDAGYPGGPKTLVAGKDTSQLNASEVSIHPETGVIRFRKNEFPTGNQRTIMSYNFLRYTYESQSGQSGIVYDATYDLNSDGRIDDNDLAIFLQAYPSQLGDANYVASYDFVNPTGGVIDDEDLDALAQHFGTVETGVRDFADATTARLAAILIFKADNPAIKLVVIRAQSATPSAENEFGKTVLFLSSATPVPVTGDYIVQFGFSALLAIGPTSITVTTNTRLPENLNLQAIEFSKVDDSSVTRNVTNNVVTVDTSGSGTVFHNRFEFQPSLTVSGDYQLITRWKADNIAIIKGGPLVKALEYDVRHRRAWGPFKMNYDSSSFKQDGTSIKLVFAPSEASFSDGTSDPLGRHLQGIPLQDISFTAILEVPTTTGGERNVWIWNHLRVAPGETAIELSFNSSLSRETRYQGLNKVPVLQPFGMATTQVALKPAFAGGDLNNDLSNLTVVRDDLVPTGIVEHRHTIAEGGVLESDLLSVTDPKLRFAAGSSITDALYELLDRVESLESLESP